MGVSLIWAVKNNADRINGLEVFGERNENS
jgi:hypothetical protein